MHSLPNNVFSLRGMAFTFRGILVHAHQCNLSPLCPASQSLFVTAPPSTNIFKILLKVPVWKSEKLNFFCLELDFLSLMLQYLSQGCAHFVYCEVIQKDR